MVVIEIPDTYIVESFTSLKEEYQNYKTKITDLKTPIVDCEIQCEKLKTSARELLEDLESHINTNIYGLNEFELEKHYDIKDKIYKEIKQDKTTIEELEKEIITNKELLEKYEENDDIEIKYLYNMLFLIKDYITPDNVTSQMGFLNYNLNNFINLIDTDISENVDDNQKTTLIKELTDIVNNQDDLDNVLLIDDIKCSLMNTTNDKPISNYVNIQSISIFSIVTIFYYYYTIMVSIIVILGLLTRDFVLYGGWCWYPCERQQYRLCSNIELLKINKIMNRYINNYGFIVVLSIISLIKCVMIR